MGQSFPWGEGCPTVSVLGWPFRLIFFLVFGQLSFENEGWCGYFCSLKLTEFRFSYWWFFQITSSTLVWVKIINISKPKNCTNYIYIFVLILHFYLRTQLQRQTDSGHHKNTDTLTLTLPFQRHWQLNWHTTIPDTVTQWHTDTVTHWHCRHRHNVAWHSCRHRLTPAVRDRNRPEFVTWQLSL